MYQIALKNNKIMRLLYFLFISCLIGGQVPFNGYQEQYISFINKTDNEEDAWVAFLKLCQKDIQYKNWVYVKRNIDAYKSKFMTKFTNYDTTRFMELKNIINFSYDNPKNYKVKWMPNNINTNKDERNPIMYNDPILNINWPIKISNISNKDLSNFYLDNDFKGFKL